jgi:predicted nucleotidyltransferase
MATSILHAVAAITERELVLTAGGARFGSAVSSHPDKLGAIAAAAQVFADHGVAYALIGGLAVGIRSGIPRATLDVHFAIATTVDRKRLTEKLKERGFGLVGEFAHSINFKHVSGEPVQLAFDASFDEMIGRAEMIRLGEIELPVVTKEDLIAMKRRAASDPSRRRSKALRDLADVALLEGDVPHPDEGW